MEVHTNVAESDIGRLRAGMPASFTVDAYPGQIFDGGYIEQIRLSSTVTQSVVTYPVIVASENAELKLLPGMTAQITFQVSELKDVLKIPNAALRFPPEKTHVRDQDQKYLELSAAINTTAERGCTVMDGHGCYSGKDVHMLFVLARQRESQKIFRLIDEIDPTAFVSQSSVIGVYGEGFDRFKVSKKISLSKR